MRLFKRDQSEYWWYDFTCKGVRYRESTKRVVKAEAQRVMAEEYSRVFNRSQFGEKPEITLADAFDKCLKLVDGATYKQYLWAKRKWTGEGFADRWHLPANLMLGDLTQDHLDEHLDERQGEGAKNNTVNAERRILKLVYKAHEKKFRVDPDLDFKMLKGFSKTRFLSPQEETAVEEYLDAKAKESEAAVKAKRLYVFLRFTGVRVGEALNATWHDINLTDGIFEVYRMKTDSMSTVPLIPRVVDLLKSVHNQPQPFIEMDRAVKHLRWAISDTCNTNERIIKQRGAATIHTLRDTYGSTLVRNGMSLHELAKLLGHTTAAMSAKYAHLESRDVSEKARRIMSA